jgi:antitoxin MazE
MEIPIVPIGNSKGIRLSKTLLKKYNIQDSVELIFEEDYLILKAIAKPRKNWDLAFKSMHESGDDKLLIEDVFEDENFEA